MGSARTTVGTTSSASCRTGAATRWPLGLYPDFFYPSRITHGAHLPLRLPHNASHAGYPHERLLDFRSASYCRLLAVLGLIACDGAAPQDSSDGAIEASDDPDVGDPSLTNDTGAQFVDQYSPCLPASSTCPKFYGEGGVGGGCEYWDDADCQTLVWPGCCGTISSRKHCLSDAGPCPTTLDAGASACGIADQWCPMANGGCLCGKYGLWDCLAQLPSCPQPTPLVGLDVQRE